ncbi:MAG TPA: hypothetical protein VFD47_02820 [Actinomycetota bacterium]|nr:hypothetical protein [Actinomycetota bacterium]
MHLTREDVRAFLTEEHSTVVSIYISTEPKAYQSERNSLRLRSALDDATKQLEKTGLRRPDVCSLTAPLRDLLDDEQFWLHQANGLALFRSDSGLETVRLPFEPGESVRVADAPYVVPLLEGLEAGERHALLAVSRNAIRLFSCTRDAVEEIDISDLRMPRSLSESMRYEDLQKPESLNHPTTGPGRVPSRAASGGRRDRRHGFHGHGESEVQEKTYVAAYLHQIDAALLIRLYDLGSPPLILAAVDYVSAIYRGVSKYRALTSETLEGSPDEMRPEELHERARPILEARWRAKVADAHSRFHERAAHGLATSKISEVVDAADAGRVDTLLVKKGGSVWGRFDASSREVTLVDTTGNSESKDLMDLAARRTLANHGTVLMLDPEVMTDDAGAILRY